MIFGMAGELGGVSKLQFMYRGIFGEILPSHVPCKRNIFLVNKIQSISDSHRDVSWIL